MKELFLQITDLLKDTESEEREAVILMYATAYTGLLQEGGYLYKCELGKDGLPFFVMTVNGKPYKCQKQILNLYAENDLYSHPYEDDSKHLDEILLPEPCRDKDIMHEEDNTRKVIEIPRIEFSEKTPFEELPEEPELTLTDEQQAQYLLDTTQYYKIGSSLNFIAALACTVFAIVVLVLC